MGHFVELVLEFLFGLAKDSPDKMSSVNYIDSFVIRHPRKKTLVRICATLVLIVVFSVLWFLVKHETRFLFVIFAVLNFILLALSVFSFSFECYVNDIIISRNILWISKKKILWKDIQCVRVVEQTNEKAVIIALYDQIGKCVIDFNTDMENVWYIVKMAEHKSINIKYEKDLSIKQLSHL